MVELWTKYEIQMDFLTKLCGSVPGDPNLVQAWIDARTPKNRPPVFKSIDEIAMEVIDAQPEDIQGSLLTFQRQEGGLVVRMGTIRAHLKDCARIISSLYVGKLEGEKSFAVRVLNGIYYPPEVYWLPILNQHDDRPITEPTGMMDKAVHARDRQGRPLNSLKRFEYVENARLRAPLLILTPKNKPPVVSDNDLDTLLTYGGTHGYAGERSDGEGRYIATIKRID